MKIRFSIVSQSPRGLRLPSLVPSFCSSSPSKIKDGTVFSDGEEIFFFIWIFGGFDSLIQREGGLIERWLCCGHFCGGGPVFLFFLSSSSSSLLLLLLLLLLRPSFVIFSSHFSDFPACSCVCVCAWEVGRQLVASGVLLLFFFFLLGFTGFTEFFFDYVWTWPAIVVWLRLAESHGFGSLYRVFTGFYWVLPGCTGFPWFLLGFTGFSWVLLGFIEFLLGFIWFYWVLLGFIEVLLGFTGFSVFLPSFFLALTGFTGFYWVLLSFYQVLSGFTGFYWVLLRFY